MEGRVGHDAEHFLRGFGWRLCFFSLLLAAAALTPARADPQQDFARAVEADLAGDEIRAFAFYSDAAQAGLAEAQFNVGLMYDSGRGVRQDAAKAALFYAFSATNGSARAADHLAILYRAGDGVPRNRALADAWLREAGRLGLADPAANSAPQPLPGAATPDRESKPTGAVSLAYPLPGAVLPARQDYVPLVWTARPDSVPTLYFVQLVGLNGTAPSPILSETRDISATRAPIGRQPGRYAWRVFSFSQSQGTYTATAWARFTIA